MSRTNTRGALCTNPRPVIRAPSEGLCIGHVVRGQHTAAPPTTVKQRTWKHRLQGRLLLGYLRFKTGFV